MNRCWRLVTQRRARDRKDLLLRKSTCCCCCCSCCSSCPHVCKVTFSLDYEIAQLNSPRPAGYLSLLCSALHCSAQLTHTRPFFVFKFILSSWARGYVAIGWWTSTITLLSLLAFRTFKIDFISFHWCSRLLALVLYLCIQVYLEFMSPRICCNWLMNAHKHSPEPFGFPDLKIDFISFHWCSCLLALVENMVKKYRSRFLLRFFWPPWFAVTKRM